MKTICEKCDDTGILPEFTGLCSCAAGRCAAGRGSGAFRVNLDSLKRDLEKIGYTPRMTKYQYNPEHVVPTCGWAELDLTGKGDGLDRVSCSGAWNIHTISPIALMVVARHLVKGNETPAQAH